LLMLRREVIVNYYEDQEKHISRHFERQWGLGECIILEYYRM